jgi:hypothetical protein
MTATLPLSIAIASGELVTDGLLAWSTGCAGTDVRIVGRRVPGGAPYVNPQEWQAEYGVSTLDEAFRRSLRPDGTVDPRCYPEAIEDDLGWLRDTGTSGDQCHRSAHAYGARVWGMLDRQDPNWGVSFRACAGTTGFGGNDIGFKHDKQLGGGQDEQRDPPSGIGCGGAGHGRSFAGRRAA